MAKCASNAMVMMVLPKPILSDSRAVDEVQWSCTFQCDTSLIGGRTNLNTETKECVQLKKAVEVFQGYVFLCVHNQTNNTIIAIPNNNTYYYTSKVRNRFTTKNTLPKTNKSPLQNDGFPARNLQTSKGSKPRVAKSPSKIQGSHPPKCRWILCHVT